MTVPRMYDGTTEIWFKSGQSGLDKRQCTVQLTIFGDGVPRVRPAVKRLKPDEKKNLDKRVKVYLQPKAWCDESIMKQWVCEEWGNIFSNPVSFGSSGKILVADVHTAQQTDEVKRLLVNKKTVLVNVPPGCTSHVQPLDVSVNKPFKNLVREQFEKHLDENLDKYVDGKLTTSERRVLTTKWVADAWQKVSENKDMIIRSFVKCGITCKLDGSVDDHVNMRGLEGYTMPSPQEEFHLESSDEDDDELTDTSEACSCSNTNSSADDNDSDNDI